MTTKNRPIPTLVGYEVSRFLKRFWAKVKVRGPDDCWEWTGAAIKGYGIIRMGRGRQKYLAHRISYFIRRGVDPGDKCVCHTCDNPRCVNPAHLWLGTLGDNNLDAIQKGRGQARGEQHSHAKFTEQDVREIRKSGEPHRSIANQYGVCKTTISRIKCGKRWKHVT